MIRSIHEIARELQARLGVCALLFVAGCSFGQEDAVVDNTCSVDTDCAADARCFDGVCVAEGSTELTFSLEVTPTRMPDGSPPIPMSLGPFLLDGRSRTFELPTPITVPGSVFGRVTNRIIPIAATLHFAPIDVPEGQTAKTIAATTTDTTDLSVQLLSGVTYRVTVEPSDTTQPPYVRELKVKPGVRLDVDYSDIKWTVQKFRVEGVPEGRTLALRAVDADSGEPLSSTAETGDGPVALRFPPVYGRFRLELSARAAYVQMPSTDAPPADEGGSEPDCDANAAGFPVLSVDDSVLRQDEEAVNVLTLPEIPELITYSGTVELCPGGDASKLGDMQMALEAQTLSLSDEDGAFRASYSASTMATRDEATGMLSFCTRVLPGDYVVVVTPPANVQCEIFAQQRHIDETSSGQTLNLRTPALLRGVIENADRVPLAQAAIEARALGLDLELPEGDVTVPSYNRSSMATSDDTGEFRLPLDMGSYDIVVKPPADSGFAWQVLHDVEIDTRSRNFVARVTLDAPVPVRGTLRYAAASRGAQETLAGAEILVFTQMPNHERSVEIGRGLADEAGKITLFIAPSLRKGL